MTNKSAKSRLEFDPIAHNLRLIYDEVVADPIPEPLLQLLKRLDRQAEEDRRE